MPNPTLREEMARAVETIILRRLHERRVDGYTLDMSKEIADAAIDQGRLGASPLHVEAAPVREPAEGWKLVPVEPTVEMLGAWHGAVEVSIFDEPLGAYQEGYAAMLAAAPVSPSPWLPIDENTPEDRFLFLYCPADRSHWLAKWQGRGEEACWFGVDELGLTRRSDAHFEPSHWMPLPAPPAGGGGS